MQSEINPEQQSRVEHLPKNSRIGLRPKRKPLVEPETLEVILRFWFIPMWFLFSLALVFYFAISLFDFDWTLDRGFMFTLLTTEKDAVADAISPFVELLVAILGIMITVIAIVLQLAAQRYGTRLIDLFLEDQINRLYFVFMVATLMWSIYLTFGVKENFLPQVGIIVLLLATQIEIALLAPYFLYVFKFLTPTNLLYSIQKSAKQAVTDGLEGGAAIAKAQREVTDSIEQVTDSALSAVNQMDRNLGLMAINQIREIVLDYQELKKDLPEDWFNAPQEFFVGISQVFYNEICEKKLWVESKAFMDMELIYKNAIRTMPDSVSVIARNMRLMGEEAIRNKDDEVLDLIVQFYNTYIRISINDKNVRAIFNLFYQYRLLAESVYEYDLEMSAKILFYFKYYGETCLQQGLWFVMVTAAFDLGGLVATAFDKKMENLERLVSIFMSLEDNVDPKKDFMAFDAIRKAQIILGTYMYSQGETRVLKLVIADLLGETTEKLINYRDALLAVKSRKFWEVTDRGYTFEYMEPNQKEWLKKLYDEKILNNEEFYAQTPEPEVIPEEKPKKAGRKRATKKPESASEKTAEKPKKSAKGIAPTKEDK